MAKAGRTGQRTIVRKMHETEWGVILSTFQDVEFCQLLYVTIHILRNCDEQF